MARSPVRIVVTYSPAVNASTYDADHGSRPAAGRGGENRRAALVHCQRGAHGRGGRMTNTAAFVPRAMGGDPSRPPRPIGTSEVMLAQVMLPSDANPSGNVHGGTLMRLAD